MSICLYRTSSNGKKENYWLERAKASCLVSGNMCWPFSDEERGGRSVVGRGASWLLLPLLALLLNKLWLIAMPPFALTNALGLHWMGQWTASFSTFVWACNMNDKNDSIIRTSFHVPCSIGFKIQRDQARHQGTLQFKKWTTRRENMLRGERNR